MPRSGALLLAALLLGGCIDFDSYVSRTGSFSLQGIQFRPNLMMQVTYTIAGQPSTTQIGDERVIRIWAEDLVDAGSGLKYGVWLDPSGSAPARLVGNLTLAGTTWSWQGKFPYQTNFERANVVIEPDGGPGKGLTLATSTQFSSQQATRMMFGSDYPQPNVMVTYQVKGRNWTLKVRSNVGGPDNQLAGPRFAGLEVCLWSRDPVNATAWNRTACQNVVGTINHQTGGNGKRIGREFEVTLEARNATKAPGALLLSYGSIEDMDHYCNALSCRKTG